MKKVFAAVPGVLAALHAIVPVCFLVAVLSGRYLQMDSPLFVAIFLSAVTLAALVLMLVFKPEFNWANSAALGLTLFFSAVTQFYFVYHAVRVYEDYDTTVPAIVFAVCTIAMIVVFINCIDDSWYKAAFGVVTVLFAMAAVAVAIYVLISDSVFGEIRHSEDLVSPGGAYKSYVTYREPGLTSDGVTYVYTVNNEESGAFIGVLKHTPKRVYTGGKLDYELIEIGWKDDETLVIDGVEYPAEPTGEEPAKPAEASDDVSDEPAEASLSSAPADESAESAESAPASEPESGEPAESSEE